MRRMAQRLHYSASTETSMQHLLLTIDLCKEDTLMPTRRPNQAPPKDAIALLKADHQMVRDLF